MYVCTFFRHLNSCKGYTASVLLFFCHAHTKKKSKELSVMIFREHDEEASSPIDRTLHAITLNSEIWSQHIHGVQMMLWDLLCSTLLDDRFGLHE